jgi:hypothetical protein
MPLLIRSIAKVAERPVIAMLQFNELGFLRFTFVCCPAVPHGLDLRLIIELTLSFRDEATSRSGLSPTVAFRYVRAGG